MPSSETEFYLRVNGDSHAVTCNPSTPLLFVLRNELGLMVLDRDVLPGTAELV